MKKMKRSKLSKKYWYQNSVCPLLAHLQQLNSEDKGLWIGLKMIQVLMPQRVVGVDLGNATAMPLAFQGVFTSTDVSQRLGHEWVQCCVLSGAKRDIIVSTEEKQDGYSVTSIVTSSQTLGSHVNSASSPCLMVMMILSHTASLNFLPRMSSMGLLRPPMVRESSSTVPSHRLVQ